MRSIFTGVVILSASMGHMQTAQAEKHTYVQAVIGHRQPFQPSADRTIGVDQVHSEDDALTKRIQQDNTRLDRVIDICPSC
jgi:hypothetical protein